MSLSLKTLGAPLRRLATGASLAIMAACGGGDCGSTCPPPPPTGRVVVTSSQVTTPAPLYAGDSASVMLQGSAVEGATGPDSIVVANGQPRTMTGSTYTGKVLSTLGSNNIAFTVHGKKSNGEPTSVVGNLGFTAQARPYELRIITQGLSGPLGGRVNIAVGAETITVPADTTIIRPAGVYQVGINGTQTHAYDYGEMDMNGAWRPIAGNQLKHALTLDANKTVTLSLLSKTDPNFTPEIKTQFDMIWPDNFAGQRYLHPTKRTAFEIVVPDSGWTVPGQGTPFMIPMTQADSIGLDGAVDSLRIEDATGPDGARRTYTITHVLDPVVAGKVVLGTNGLWRSAPGVILAGRAPPGGQSNPMHYDAQGFLDGGFVRAGGDSETWMSEFKGFSDMVYFGQEGNRVDWSRNATPGGGAVRGSLDTFTYNNLMRIAWRAGQNNFGLLKAPQ